MALRTGFTNISEAEDWQKFFLEELKLSPELAESYSEEFASQTNVTGRNIVVGLAEPGFLNQFNMSVGHQLELKTIFSSTVKPEPHNVIERPNNKIPTPMVNMNISQMEFDQFRFEWDKYKEHYRIVHNVATSLFFCCSEEVRQQIRIIQAARSLPWTEDTLMEAIWQTVLSKVSPIVHIKQFFELKQESHETVQQYLQKLQAKASCCGFHCRTCQSSSIEDRVREKFILGLRDTVVQRSALKTESITPDTPLSRLLTEATTIEQSIRDQESISAAAVERSACLLDEQSDCSVNAVNMHKSKKFNKCSHCGLSDHSSYERKEKCPAWGKKCNNCQILHHFKSMCLKPKRRGQHSVKSIDSAEILFIGEVSSSNQLPVNMQPEGTQRVVQLDVFPDTGANICLMGQSQLKQLGVTQSSLHPCCDQIAVAGGSTIPTTGWMKIKITLREATTEATVYFSKRAKRFFLSRRCCRELNIIPLTFPYPPQKNNDKVIAVVEPDTTLKVEADTVFESKRVTPSRPSEIPFAPIEGNIPALKRYILDKFASSVFSNNKPFPKLSTPPAKIHLKPDHVVPKPAYWPATVAEHWSEEVKRSIEQDVEAGILTKVPFNEATEWCARMVVVPKKDGRPRRTVDFQQLNKQCLREPNHGESPFHTARRVPENTWKSVFDAIDGYHSVEIDPESSKLTTFITPWGRYRYLRFPQGHCSAGDAFNGRVQKILSQIPRLVRIVDDICLYDQTIENAFWHAWDLLTTCAENGIMLNEAKFQFCSPIVDFAGLTITMDGVRPSEKILRAIRDFPPPSDITKARAFFGLINQVQWAYANSSKMAPFRELVKPNSLFQWNPELTDLFEEAKAKILEQVEAGVRKFSVNRPTCLQTDFCKDGVGYLLLQKFCKCAIDKAPLCCPQGWKLVFAGSRFTKGAETRYAPTEGEAMAVAWALNHAHIFTKGCPQLIISTDHKPLLGILNDRPMEEIKNPRIVRLKEHMLQFDFVVRYNPGKWHRAPDALSRNPSPPFVEMLQTFAVQHVEDNDADNINSLRALSAVGPLDSVTLEKVRNYTASDAELQLLITAIRDGFLNTQHSTDSSIRSFFNAREHLWVKEGVVMFKSRVVIPKKLRQHVLNLLHSAHQGVEGMRARAAVSVYWPGMNSSIAQIRRNCKFCDSIAPSHPRQPLHPLPPSEYPFQFICADAFELKGHQYLVVIDKFSGWLILFHFLGNMGAKQITDSLRSVFHTYGAPMRIYTDGGLAFASQETKHFLETWGVEHIISSAHYPQSNGRAELGVKTAKRILHENVSSTGSLNTEAASKALLQYRNTPIQGVGLSPAQILFHRNLRDSIPVQVHTLKPHHQWILAAQNRERALQKRNMTTAKRYNTFTRDLGPLEVGTKVLVQDYKGKRRWNKTGTVVERSNRKYTVRNRRFLKAQEPQDSEFVWTPDSDSFPDEDLVDTVQPVSQVSVHNVIPQTNTSHSSDTSFHPDSTIHSTDESTNRIVPVKRMLTNLFPHNKPGLKEL